MTSTDALVIELDRVLPAPPETVFRAITDAALLPRWMGPEGSTCTVEELELTLGGCLALRVTFPGGPSIRLTGYYEEIDPPRRLVHSWGTDDEEITSTVVWELEPVGSGTRLRLTHLGLTLPDDVEQNEAGWGHLLDRLETVVSG